MKNETLNATIKATMENGFIKLTLSCDGLTDVSIKVNDFGGTQKKTAKKLTYALYKKVNK